MVTRGRETQDMGNTGLTLLPPPERCVPHRTPSNGEGGWALWRPPGTRRQDRRLPGRRPFQDPRPSGELGRPWRIGELGWPWQVRELGQPWWIRELGRPWRDYLRGRGPSPRPGLFGWSPTTPPKNFLGKIGAGSGKVLEPWFELVTPIPLRKISLFKCAISILILN